jgi:hypothetical protein
MRPVAAGDEIAADLLLALIDGEATAGPFRGQVPQADVGDPEEDGLALVDARLDQVADHLLLPIGDDGPAGEIGGRDPVAAAVETDLDALIDQALAPHPPAEAEVVQEGHGPVLEDAGPHPAHAIRPRAVLEDHRLDARMVEQVGEDEPRRPGSDDGDLGLHGQPSCRTRAGWKG